MYCFTCRSVHGLIFLFKWVMDQELDGSIVQDSRLQKIFFAKQVLSFDVHKLFVHIN